MGTIKKAVDKVVCVLCIALFSMMVILVTYQVITRYFFNQPSSFSEVLAKYMFVWLVMLCSAYVFGLREHMNIGFVRSKMPHKMAVAVEMFGEFLILLFAIGVMVYGGYSQSSKQMIQMDSSLPIPFGVIYLCIPIAGALMIFYFINSMVELSAKMKENKPAPAKGE